MSRKRPATDPPEATEEEPGDGPFYVLTAMVHELSQLRQMLLEHCSSISECMRILTHLHQTLDQARNNSSDRLSTLGTESESLRLLECANPRVRKNPS